MGNPVTQFQILSKKPDETAAFYGKLFGWRIDANNATGYRRMTRVRLREFRVGSGPRRRKRRTSFSCSSPSTT